MPITAIKARLSLRNNLKINVLFPIILIVFGTIGASASAIINSEKVEKIRHPKTVLACDLNPIYSCANVIDSKHSKTFGVANELIGIAMFSIIVTVGVMTIAGAVPKKWFWQLFILGMLGFSAMTVFLWYQSVYVIGSLCIFCTTAWFSGWAITMGLFTWMYDQKYFAKNQKDFKKFLVFVRKNNVAVWLGVILLLIAFTLKHFWYYYGPKLGF